MKRWLAICSVLPLGAATAAQGQLKQLAPAESPRLAPPRTAHFSVSADSWTNDPPALSGGMITTDDMGPNTVLGVGLVKMHGRKRSGSDLRPGAPEVQTRNPAVTFVVKF